MHKYTSIHTRIYVCVQVENKVLYGFQIVENSPIKLGRAPPIEASARPMILLPNSANTSRLLGRFVAAADHVCHCHNTAHEAR